MTQACTDERTRMSSIIMETRSFNQFLALLRGNISSTQFCKPQWDFILRRPYYEQGQSPKGRSIFPHLPQGRWRGKAGCLETQLHQIVSCSTDVRQPQFSISPVLKNLSYQCFWATTNTLTSNLLLYPLCTWWQRGKCFTYLFIPLCTFISSPLPSYLFSSAFIISSLIKNRTAVTFSGKPLS